MSVQIHCPFCDATGRVNSRFRGRRVHCPKCHEWVDVPDEAESSSGDEDIEIIVDTESFAGEPIDSVPFDPTPVALAPISDDAFDDMFADSYESRSDDGGDIGSVEIVDDDAELETAATGVAAAVSTRAGVGDMLGTQSTSLVTGSTLHRSHEVTEGHSQGLEFDEDGDELPKRKKREDGELDMTPMVDVTFLLLIFFMVTASFALQKSIQMPRQQSDAPSSSPIEEETEELDSVEVQIDERGSFLVLGPDWERETPGKQNLISALKDAMGGAGMEGMRLVIKVQEAAKLQALVDCMDAGTIAGYTELQVTQVEEFD